jgi:hypothetical protein
MAQEKRAEGVNTLSSSIASNRCREQTGTSSQTSSSTGVITACVAGFRQICSGFETAMYCAHGRAGSIWIIICSSLYMAALRQQACHKTPNNRNHDDPPSFSAAWCRAQSGIKIHRLSLPDSTRLVVVSMPHLWHGNPGVCITYRGCRTSVPIFKVLHLIPRSRMYCPIATASCCPAFSS